MGEHPPYLAMIQAAIKELKEKKGSSRKAIIKVIIAKYKVGSDEKKVANRVRLALKKGVTAKKLVNLKGASGRYKKATKAEKPKTPKKAAKPKKAKTPKAKK